MLKQHHQAPHLSPGLFESAFLKTVLRLRGIEGAASNQQLVEARRSLEFYRLEAMKAREQGDEQGDAYGPWRYGQMPEQVAIERAFVYVRFKSVLAPTTAQTKALHAWLAAGRYH